MSNVYTALKNNALTYDTATLLGALDIWEAKADLSHEERISKAATSDAITERYELDDLMDEVFMDEDFAGTYTDALRICLAKVGR